MRKAAYQLAAVSHVGRRPHQEDSYLARKAPWGAVLAVADGMGGHAAGEIASGIAVRALRKLIPLAAAGDPATGLRSAADRANAEILEYARNEPGSDGLGTTLVAAVIRNGGAVVAHAGDSRAWLVTADEAVQLTKDHSAVQDAIDRGSLEEEQAAHSPYRDAIIRNLGDPSFPGLEFSPTPGMMPMPQNSILLLTSDGAHGHLTTQDICEHLVGTKNLKSGIENLARLAFARGSTDNITLVGCEMGTLKRSSQVAPKQPPIPRRRGGGGHSRALLPAILFGFMLAVLAFLVFLVYQAVKSNGRDGGEQPPTGVIATPVPTPTWPFATPIPTTPKTTPTQVVKETPPQPATAVPEPTVLEIRKVLATPAASSGGLTEPQPPIPTLALEPRTTVPAAPAGGVATPRAIPTSSSQLPEPSVAAPSEPEPTPSAPASARKTQLTRPTLKALDASSPGVAAVSPQEVLLLAARSEAT